MAGGSKAEELLGVVGTDQSTSPLARDYVFSERAQSFARVTLSCSGYYFNSSQRAAQNQARHAMVTLMLTADLAHEIIAFVKHPIKIYF